MFNLTEEELKQKNAWNTASEIYHQPEVWSQLAKDFLVNQESLKSFVKKVYEKHDHVRVLFTGAGTSAFAGDTIVPQLQNTKQVSFEAAATTDIVSNPEQYLMKEMPTILVSFARSGNSPESLAAVELGRQIIDDFYQVNITCNKDGVLAKNSRNDEKSLTILTPEKAHDQGFAMTSSFTSMILLAYALFSGKEFTDQVIRSLAANGKRVLDSLGEKVDDVLAFDFERIVYLGSGLLGQLSHEAALKMLELSAGQVAAIHESSLGFRHGPKSILNDKTLTVLFMSQNPYTRKYDLDILRELAADETNKIVAVTERSESEVAELADWVLAVNEEESPVPNDFYLALLYVLFPQTLALKKSIQLGITPDNPSPDGKVNRVVQGVTIYSYKRGE